jgi:hypothetical protein
MVWLILLLVFFSFTCAVLFVAVCMQSSRFSQKDGLEERFSRAEETDQDPVAQPKREAEASI